MGNSVSGSKNSGTGQSATPAPSTTTPAAANHSGGGSRRSSVDLPELIVIDKNGQRVALPSPAECPNPGAGVFPCLEVIDTAKKSKSFMCLYGRRVIDKGKAKLTAGGAVEEKETFHTALAREFNEEVFHNLMMIMRGALPDVPPTTFPLILEGLRQHNIDPRNIVLLPPLETKLLAHQTASYNAKPKYVYLTCLMALRAHREALVKVMENMNLLARLVNEQRVEILSHPDLPGQAHKDPADPTSEAVDKTHKFYVPNLRKLAAHLLETKPEDPDTHRLQRVCRILSVLDESTEFGSFGLVERAELIAAVQRWKVETNNGKDKADAVCHDAFTGEEVRITHFSIKDVLPLVEHAKFFKQRRRNSQSSTGSATT